MPISKFSKFRNSPIGQALGGFRREMWVIGIFSAVINLLMLSPTLYMLQVFDRVMISRSELTLLALTGFVMFFYAVQAFCEWMRSRMIIGSGLRLDAVLSEGVFRATFHEQLRRPGGAPSQPFADMTVIRQWLTGAGVFAFFDLPWSPIYLGAMFMLHPWLGWLTILFMAVLAAFAWWNTRGTRELGEQAEEEERELNLFIHTKLRNADVIEAHGMVPHLLKRWWKRQVETLQIQSNAQDIEERFSVSSKELRVLMQSLALGAGALLAVRGELSMGAMVAASLLMGRATSPIDQIVGGWRSFINVRKSFVRLEKLLDSDVPEGREKPNMEGPATLTLRGVQATAPGRKAPILSDINAEFPAGFIYGILGNSGAGKSTLGKVLMGIWPHVEGEVLLNGQPLHSLDREALGSRVGYLPQEVELFAGTVAMNIARLGEPVSEKVVDAARMTGTHDLILRLPKGYDSPIGDGGSYLSGGQRQRVALARALYGTPGLVVLDEPNANLDDVGEDALCRALLEMKKRGSTVFLITHRPSVLRIVDKVVLMSGGRIDLYGDRDAVRAELEGRRAQRASDVPAAAPVARPAAPAANT